MLRKWFIEKYDKNLGIINGGINYLINLKSFIIESEKETSTQLNKLKDPKEMNKLKRLLEKISEGTNKHKDPEQYQKCNKILYWNYTKEIKHSNWEKVYKLWFQINNQDKSKIKAESEITLDEKKTDIKKSIEKFSTQLSENGLEPNTRFIKKDSNSLIMTTKIVYINNHIPLKGWNLKLNVSINLNDSFATCFSCDYENQNLIVGTNIGNIKIFDCKNWEIIDEFSTKDYVKEVLYLNDGKSILSIDNSATIIKYDISSKEKNELIIGDAQSNLSADYLMDGVTLLVSNGQKLLAFNVNTNEQILEKSSSFEGIITNVLYIRQIKLLVLGLEDGNIIIFDPNTLTIITKFSNHKEKILCMSPVFYQGEISIASCSIDRTINIHGLLNKQLLKSIRPPDQKTNLSANHLIYGYDEKTLITTHDDGTILLNNYNTGDLFKNPVYKSFNPDGEKITAAVYWGDGSSFIVGTEGKKIEIYNI